jgi:hypothetical protein
MALCEHIVYYISKKEIGLHNLKQVFKTLPAYIEVIFIKNDSMSVIDLHSTKHGKEYALHLIINACHEAQKRGISTITLDDCSDRYRQSNNIYTKLGMKYDDEIGPEMTGKVDDISKYKTVTDAPTIYSIVVDT